MKKGLMETCEKHARLIMLVLIGLQIILLVGTLIRFGVVYAPDSNTYIIPAKNFLSTGTLIASDGYPILFRTPGYCMFLALVYFITDYSDLAVVLLQCLMVLATNYMIYYIVSKVTGKSILGCVASLFYICDAAVYEYAVSLLTDTVMPFLLMLSFVFFYNYYKSHRVIWFALCAIVLNCAMMVRPQIMYYNMLIVLVCLILALLKRIGWKECVIYIAIFVLTYGGWSVRNYNLFGEAMFSSVRVSSYYAFYAPLAYSIDVGVSVDEGEEYLAELLYEKYHNFDELSKMEQIHAKEDIGKSYINSHIFTYLKMNITGLFNEMLGPCATFIGSWNFPRFIYLILCCFVAGMLLLSYCIYAVGYLKTLNRQTWFDWLILLTVMYLMASTAVLGYSRFRLAFYPLCLVGTFTCYKKSRRAMVREGIDGNSDLKGIICDLDGTLYRQKPVRIHMFFSLFGYYLFHANKWRQLYGIYMFRKIREREEFRQESYIQQIEYVSGKAKIGKEELDNAIQHWMFQYPLRLVGNYADKYLISTLTDVQGRGVKVIIYSDYPVEDKLEVLGVKPDYVFYPGVNGIDSLKPSQEAMEVVMEKVNMKPYDLLFIGDRQDKDGVSAELVGIKFVLA